MNIKNLKNILMEIGILLVGAFLYAMSMNQFLIPGNIVLGGASGFSVALNDLTGFPVSLGILCFNLPFLLINIKLYGVRFCLKTVVGVGLTSLFTEIFQFFPTTVTDPFLCALFGSITMAVGCGIMFTRGYTTGGTDLVAWMLRYKWKSISTGRLITFCDLFIIVGAAIAKHSYESVFYSLIAIYLFGRIVDLVLEGAGRGKLVWIISGKYDNIAERINEVLERGMTVLNGSGWYSGQEKQILLCAVRTTELFRIKQIVREIDERAFVIVCDAGEVLGEGFEHPGFSM